MNKADVPLSTQSASRKRLCDLLRKTYPKADDVTINGFVSFKVIEVPRKGQIKNDYLGECTVCGISASAPLQSTRQSAEDCAANTVYRVLRKKWSPTDEEEPVPASPFDTYCDIVSDITLELPPGWECVNRASDGSRVFLDHYGRKAYDDPPYTVWKRRKADLEKETIVPAH